ncbi:MAG: DEAD/DEAH box helicase [Acidimicrobiales bacterium]
MTPPVLRDYQTDALDAIDAAFVAGKSHQLVALPTGTGKTIVFAELIRRRGGRALVIAHRDELLAQTEAKLVHAGIDSAAIGWVKAGRDEVGARVVLASMQTIARKTRRERLLAGKFNTVVIDEAHHVPATSYQAFIADLDAPLLLGVTATPNRDGVRDVFGTAVFERDLIDMIASGWLADLRGRRVLVEDLDFAGIARTAGDYNEAALIHMLERAETPEVVAKAWSEFGEERPTLVFTPGVDLAHKTADAIARRCYVKAEAVWGAMPLDERHAVLDRYRAGETKVIVNCAVLTEGVDLPETACIVIARPTLSPILYAQMIGRGSRLAPGKDDCLVIDVVGATERHDLSAMEQAKQPVTLNDLTEVDLDDGDSLLEAVLRDRDLALRHARIIGHEVELFSRRALRWKQLDSRVHFLGLGKAGHVCIAPTSDDDTYNVLHLLPRTEGTVVNLGKGLRLDAATVIAEQLARKLKVTYLADVNAAWRTRPVTDKQWDLIDKMRLSYQTEPLTCGEASDILDQAFAVRRVRELVGSGHLKRVAS